MHSSVNHSKSSYTARVSQAVKRAVTICFCLFALVPAYSLQAVPVNAAGRESGPNPSQWSNTIALTTLGGSLYTIEKSGALYRTDLNTGKWVQLGKAEFGNTRFLFADTKNLYTIETDGSLFRVNPVSGAWNRVGQGGVWKDTITLVTLNDSLYSIERSGALYRTNLSNGQWVQSGKAEFANTKLLFADGQNLYTIEADGSLYRVNPASGAWSQVGSAGAWKNTIVGTTLNGRIYSVESGGALYETNPANGVWKQIGKAEFANAKFLFGADGSLYSLEAGGLYRINPSTGTWVVVGRGAVMV